MQLPPQPLLQGLVKHYLILNQKPGQLQQYRMFSDGNPGLVFHLKNPLMQWTGKDSKPEPQRRSFAYGQLTRHNTIAANGQLDMIVVVLQPHALFSHFNIPAHQLNDSTVALNDLFGQEATELQEQVLQAFTTPMAINFIEQFLLKKLQENKSKTCPNELSAATNFIYRQHGIVTISDLLKVIPITERQLERKFREYIGVSPKRFADTIKFQHLLKRLQKQIDQEHITDLIYQSGYYDQAHLNHSFRKMTGLTPAHYKNAVDMLAINLMPIH